VKTKREQISGVDCLVDLDQDSTTAIVLLHGYGANMQDLHPLGEIWHRPGLSWYFPNGIYHLGMGFYEGRAWFSIDISELERAQREGRMRDLKNSHPPELETTLIQLEKMLDEISKRHQKIIIGGFSQGAMCAVHLAAREKMKFSGLILLSGALIAQDLLPEKVTSPLPFYQSHGTHDQILSVDGARDLEEKLKSFGYQGKLELFRGGHEIPQIVIDGVAASHFLSD
jgi:phospholipase/carboxylesterase